MKTQAKSKNEFFVKMIKITIKDKMGQTALPFDQRTCFDRKTNSLGRKTDFTRLNQISSFVNKNDQNIFERTVWVKQYCP